MKLLSKSLLAVTGLALSVACAPAFKGEGGKKPNLQRLLKIQEKKLTENAKELAHISSVERNKKKTDKGYKFTLKLENVPDLKKKTRVIYLDLAEPKNQVGLTIKGKGENARLYTIEARCLANCDQLAAVLTSEPISAAEEEDSAYAAEKEVMESEEEVAESEETKEAGITAGPVAPPANLSKLSAPQAIQTGVIADALENKILTLQPLDPEQSFEEQIQKMLGLVVQKQMFNIK